MKWFVVLVLCLGAELAEGGALRCVPGEDPSCTAKETEKVEKRPLVQGRECEPGSRWRSRCAQCECKPDGNSVCVDAPCAVELEPERRCAPASSWRFECNTCWCGADGRAACTRVGCAIYNASAILGDASKVLSASEEPVENDRNQKKIITKITKVTSSSKEKFDDTEHPDVEIEKANKESLERSFEELDYNIYDNDLNHAQTVQDQYNDLEESGRDGKSKKHVLLKRSVCKPNEVFMRDCNPCKCTPDGQGYVCTHNECMEGEQNKDVEIFMNGEGSDHIERHMVCAARGTFYIGCNTCHCNALGTDYSCTNKPCPLPEDVELFHELKAVKSSSNKSKKQVCVANRMFIMDCNTCWCNDDGTSYICTRRVCVPDQPEDGPDRPEELRVIRKECRPNEVFELDCNMCRCNPDGKSYSCTRRACAGGADPFFEPVDPVIEPVDPAIEPVDDMLKNTSLIRKTRGVTQEARKACVPGQEFRMDCNTCLCDNDGQEFSCTRNDCANNGGASNGNIARAKREATQSLENVTIECVPGSVFQRGCNACRCASDGRYALCTNQPCAPDLTTPAEAEPEFVCKPGDQWKRACNDCHCAADGRAVLCTVRLCDDVTVPEPL